MDITIQNSKHSERTDGLARKRSLGVLDAAELARGRGVALAYDPVQIGWVALACDDDLDPKADERAVRADDAAERRMRLAEVTGRYRLRPWREEDVATFVDLLDNPRIWRHLPEAYPDPLTEDLARDLIALSNASDHHEVLAAEYWGRVIGQVRLAFDRAAPDRSAAEISYWLGEPFWGRGHGAGLVAFFTRMSFRKRPDLRSIFARVHEANVASARALEKSGYRREGSAPDDAAIVVYRIHRGDPLCG